MSSIKNDHAQLAIVIGGLEIFTGVLVFVPFYLTSTKDIFGFFDTPFWVVIMFLVTGIVGIIAGAKKNQNVMIAFMVLNGVSSIGIGIASYMCIKLRETSIAKNSSESSTVSSILMVTSWLLPITVAKTLAGGILGRRAIFSAIPAQSPSIEITETNSYKRFKNEV